MVRNNTTKPMRKFLQHPFINSIKTVVLAFNQDRCFDRAGSLAYSSLLTIVPLLTILLLVVTTLPSFKPIEAMIEDFFFNTLVASSNETVHTYIRTFALQATRLSWISIMFLLVTVILLLHSIESTFNDIWKSKLTRAHLLKKMFRYCIFALFTPALLGAALLFNTHMYILLHIHDGIHYHDPVRNILQLFPSFMIFILMFSIYKFLPRAKIPTLAAALGALFTTVVFITTKVVFRLYIHLFSGYKLLYGAFAALPIFLIWLYIAWLIILLGFEIIYHVYARQVNL